MKFLKILILMFALMGASGCSLYFKYLQKKATGGDPESQLIVGGFYAGGVGTEKSLPKAFYWIERSANQGFALGQSSLGILYSQGKGTKKNNVLAYKWLLLAKAQGLQEKATDKTFSELKQKLTPQQVSKAKQLADLFQPKTE